MRRIVKYCRRCSGTGVIARRGSPIKYVTCTRCAGHKGQTEDA